MRQVHRAGAKLFVDYADKKPSIIDATTGEVIEVELFVAVLGASNYTYAEATRTQQVPDWIASHQRAFAFLGGVTAALVCDQLKSGVVSPCRYEPGLQRTYEELAQHYGTVILPARPAKARERQHRRDLLPRPARRCPSPQRRARSPHHRSRPHAEGPPAPSGVDALADHRLGADDRPPDRGPRRGHPRRPPAP